MDVRDMDPEEPKERTNTDLNTDPDLTFKIKRIRIRPSKKTRIRIQPQEKKPECLFALCQTPYLTKTPQIRIRYLLYVQEVVTHCI